MEARDVLQSVRARGGLSQADLARMAGIAPSTVSRIERGELEPTWSVMNRLLESAGYRPAGGLVSTGDVNAVAAARAVLGELADATRNDGVRSWIDRWTRARFVDENGRARDVEKIGVQAGIASRLFDRSNPKLSVVYDRSWRDIVTSLQRCPGRGHESIANRRFRDDTCGRRAVRLVHDLARADAGTPSRED